MDRLWTLNGPLCAFLSSVRLSLHSFLLHYHLLFLLLLLHLLHLHLLLLHTSAVGATLVGAMAVLSEKKRRQTIKGYGKGMAYR